VGKGRIDRKMLDCQTEITLAKLQDDFKNISNELMIVIKLNGAILEVNYTAERILQQKTGNFFDLFTGDYRKQSFEFMDKLIKSSKIVKERLVHTIDGKLIEIKYTGVLKNDMLLLSGIVLSGEHGLNSQPEEILQTKYEKEKKLRDLLCTKLEIGILFIDPLNNVHFCNDPFLPLVGLNQTEELIGNNITQFVHPHPILSHIKDMIDEIRKSKSDADRYYYEEEYLYQIQGVYCEVDGSISFAVYDRSYQHQFENLLLYKKQMESVSHLAAGVAHELRNPLSVIKGFMQLASLTNDLTKFYDTVMSEINRMNDIIEDFLSVSRKSMKKVMHKPNSILKSLVYIIRSECLLHDLTFDYRYETINGFVHVNEAMIKQVILNLLRNAIEAYEGYERNRDLKLTAYSEQSFYVIEVEDQGPGMDQETLDQLGKPFFTTKEKGTGIGIPLCKKIIEDHGGQFIIKSELGKGTKITFTLPILEEAEIEQ
jgi:signal transduction histidine kinase